MPQKVRTKGSIACVGVTSSLVRLVEVLFARGTHTILAKGRLGGTVSIVRRSSMLVA